MKKKYKRDLLKMFSQNLTHFFPDVKDHFMCPTCLKKIPISQTESISEAHIVPKAAGGRLKTLICRKCNSDFGAKQDKWFGELVRLSQSGNPSILNTKIKEGCFKIDDLKVNGRWEIDQSGKFNFLIYKNLNSPEIPALLDKKFRSSPPKINLSFSLPLMKNTHLIDVGFLTAGYLMWFAHLGYSWVLQNHLDPIREQILNPEKDIIHTNYVATLRNGVSFPLWMGFMPIQKDVVLTFGVGSHITVLPPRYNQTLYSSLGTFSLNLNISEIRAIKLPEKPYYEEPAGLMFEDKMLVFPDTPSKKPIFVIRFTRQEKEGQILRPVGEEEYIKLSRAPNVIKQTIKL